MIKPGTKASEYIASALRDIARAGGVTFEGEDLSPAELEKVARMIELMHGDDAPMQTESDKRAQALCEYIGENNLLRDNRRAYELFLDWSRVRLLEKSWKAPSES